jgi:hypothetical protein
LVETYRRGRAEAHAGMVAARDALVHAWLEAHPEIRDAPQPPSPEDALLQAQAWIARGCPVSWAPEAPQGPAAEQVAAHACQAYDDALRQRGMAEAWTEALRQVCAVLYGGHRAAGGAGSCCERCDAPLDTPAPRP